MSTLSSSGGTARLKPNYLQFAVQSRMAFYDQLHPNHRVFPHAFPHKTDFFLLSVTLWEKFVLHNQATLHYTCKHFQLKNF